MKNNKPHFLLIHGAWHGGWVWNEISEILRYQRYSVSTPTLTGLGEKKHLLSSKITIETFIEDIVNHIVFENLNNIILVGHSFAGSVISGVADRLKDRIQKLIYFDAMILIDGQKPFDITPKETVEQKQLEEIKKWIEKGKMRVLMPLLKILLTIMAINVGLTQAPGSGGLLIMLDFPN